MSKKTAAPLDLKTLKTGSCKTLSGRSTLQYALSANAAGDLYFRITGNDGGGNYAAEAVAWQGIEAALDAEEEGFSALALRPLYKQKSANNPGFLLAILRHLELVQPVEGKVKLFEQLDPEPFLQEMAQLKADDAPTKKAPAKKKKAPRKKAAAAR